MRLYPCIHSHHWLRDSVISPGTFSPGQESPRLSTPAATGLGAKPEERGCRGEPAAALRGRGLWLPGSPQEGKCLPPELELVCSRNANPFHG